MKRREARDYIEEVRAQLGDRAAEDREVAHLRAAPRISAPKIVTPPPTRRPRGR